MHHSQRIKNRVETWRRKWPPAPVFLPGEFHGEETGGLQSQGCIESDMSERLTLSCSGRNFQLQVTLGELPRFVVLCVKIKTII